MLEMLEDRVTPATTSISNGTLTISLNKASEAVTVSNTGAAVKVQSTAPITGGTSFAGVNRLVVTNTGGLSGQTLTLAYNGQPFTLSGGLLSTNVATVKFYCPVIATGNSSVNVTASQSIVVNSNITGGTGGVSLTGLGQAALNTVGVTVQSGAVVSATGGGNVAVRGVGGGAPFQGFNNGVLLTGSGSTITSGGGTVAVTGTGGGAGTVYGGNVGVYLYDVGTLISSGGGAVTVMGTGGGAPMGSTNSGIKLRGQITAGGSGAVTVNGTGGGGGTGSSFGVYLEGSGVITSGGGDVTVTGTGGSGTGSANWGVIVFLPGSKITSGGGTVSVTGVGTTTSEGIRLDGGIISSGSDAPITLTTDSLNIVGSPLGSIDAGTAAVTIQTRTTNALINVGGADVLNSAPFTLGLSAAELAQITAGELRIGRNDAPSSGTITVTANTVFPSNANVTLLNGADIVINASVNASGTLTLAPGTASVSVKPTASGTDITASTTSFVSGRALNIRITGATVDTEYTQLNVTGTVDLTGAALVLTGNYVPAPNTTFTIVSATNIIGTFNGLANNAIVVFNGVPLRIVYTPTSVILASPASPVITSDGGGAAASISVPENTTAVTTVTATDSDLPSQTLTYSIVGGADAAKFGIDPASGVLTFLAAADYETPTDGGSDNVYDVVVQVSDGALTDAQTVAVTVTNTNLQITDFTPTPSGFVVTFNAPIGTDELNLYTAAGTSGPADVTLTGPSGSVRGSMVLNSSRTQATFVATGGVLAPGAYTAALRAASDGFASASGSENLDGDGTAGDNYTTSFTTSPSTARVLSLPDFARGVGQPVNVPATETGLPLRISDADGVTEIEADLFFDSTLLTVSTGTFSTPFGGALTVTATSGGVHLSVTGLTDATGSDVSIATLTASVPDTAPYASKHILDLANVAVNGGAFEALDDDAVQVAAYLGDVSGDQILDAIDVSQLTTLAGAFDETSGFAAYRLADSLLIGDVSGDGTIDATDVSQLASKTVGEWVPTIPDIPTGIAPPATGGPDPRLYLVSASVRPGEIVTVQLRMEVTERSGAELSAGDYAIQFDPTVVRVSNVRTGSMLPGFTTFANVDNEAGTIRVTQFSAHPLQFAFGTDGAVVLFDVTVLDNAQPGLSVLNLMEKVESNGSTTWTSLDGPAGRLVLFPAPTDGGTDPGDAALTILSWVPLTDPHVGLSTSDVTGWGIAAEGPDTDRDGSRIQRQTPSAVNELLRLWLAPDAETDDSAGSFAPLRRRR